MEASGFGGEDEFEVFGSADSAIAAPKFEGTNVCRSAALSTLLAGDRRLVAGVSEPLIELGFSDGLSSGEWTLGDLDAFSTFEGLQELDSPDSERVAAWSRLRETAAPQDGVAFLVTILGSQLERESAAAAAALYRHIGQIGTQELGRIAGRRSERFWYFALGPGRSRDPLWEFPWYLPGQRDLAEEAGEAQFLGWEPRQWRDVYERSMRLLGDRYDNLGVVSLLVRWRLSRALRSPDPITRSLALATFWPAESDSFEPMRPDRSTPPLSQAARVSTMIHGTKAWAGTWWEPGGDFHRYIHDEYRSNLCNRGAVFSWNGAYRADARELAGSRFAKWAGDLAAGGLETVFGHSYGGEVAARAVVSHQAQIDELVLLSTPVTNHIDAAVATGVRVVDIRLRFDPVLALARTRQRIAAHPHVTEVLLKRWRLNHSASHESRVWQDETVADLGGIRPC